MGFIEDYLISGVNNSYRLESTAIGTYEVHLNDPYNIDELLNPDGLGTVDYVDTSVCYANDYVLNPTLTKHKSLKVISKIPPQMTNQYEFMRDSHMTQLGRKKIDIMLIHNSRSDKWKELAKLMESDKSKGLYDHTGVSNFSVSQIEEYHKLIGHYPEYNEMEINPEYYDQNLIEFCHRTNIKIIAYAILGGKYNARRMISNYGLDYLLRFVAENAEIVIVRSDNRQRLEAMTDILTYIKCDTHKLIVDPVASLSTLLYGKKNKSIIPDKYDMPSMSAWLLLKSDQFYQSKELRLSNDILPMAVIPTYIRSSANTKSDYKLVITEAKDCPRRYLISNIDEFMTFIDDETIDFMPEFEFLTDYQVYYRYLLINCISKRYRMDRGTHPRFWVYGDIQYVDLLDNCYDVRTRYMLSVALMNNKFELSKIRDLGGGEICTPVVSFMELTVKNSDE